MSTKSSSYQFMYPGILILIGSLLLASCVPYSPDTEHQTNSIAAAFAYPPPSVMEPTLPILLPTQADGSPNSSGSIFATPSPLEKVEVASISEVTPESMPIPRYSVESGPIVGGPEHWRAMYIVDSVTGNKVRLGNDSGTAVYGAMSDEYFLWFFLCDQCQDVKSGLHAYSLKSGENKLIADNAYSTFGSVKIAGNWVTYISVTGKYTADLYAHNVATGEVLLVASDVLHSSPFHAGNSIFSVVNEGKVAWVAIDLESQKAKLKVHDLATQITQDLEISTQYLPLLRDLSVSDQIVVWRNEAWWGYDLIQRALFTVPVVPPGWDVSMIKSVGPITAKGAQLFWSLESDEKTYYFTATVTEKGSQPPRPTPELPVPTVLVQPTSYP